MQLYLVHIGKAAETCGVATRLESGGNIKLYGAEQSRLVCR